jgi:Ca2+-binding EF-hand superfamily protein
MQERHRNATSAFRSFDVRGKGALKKGDLVNGFDKLRIKISSEDMDTVWKYLDSSNRGCIYINEFCAMGEPKAYKPQDTTTYFATKI